jgi:RNA polymerase sigma factor (sigma-70 family)
MELIYQPTTDSQVWKDFKNGSKAAYAYMYRTFAPVLYNYGYKICQKKELVEDCIQDLFIHLLLHKDSLSDTDSIKYYLFKSLRHSIISKLGLHHQESHPADMLEYSDFQIELSYEVQLVEQQFTQERIQQLEKAIHQLPARQKEAIFLRFYDDLSYEQIASIMGIDQRSVYKVIYKALDGLQKQMVQDLALCLLVLSHGWII